MGDMNWHAHVGITTAPVRVAVQHRVPLVIWGEHGYLDLGGQFSIDDFPEMSYRDRLRALRPRLRVELLRRAARASAPRT